MSSNITLAITGASGVVYGLRLLEQLLLAQQTVHLVISEPAHKVIEFETDALPSHADTLKALLLNRYAVPYEQLYVYHQSQWTAPIASGSNASQAMVICPCTNGTLAAIANGMSRSLIERAADVALKEQRRLILVHRETPLSALQLENMLRLARLGVVIMPANPGFYHRPTQVSQMVDFIVARVLDHLNITHNLLPRWGTSDYE